MSDYFITSFRSELRRAAVRRVRSYQRRRRLSAALAVAVAAFLVAGGAIAAESFHWFGPSSYEIRLRAAHDQFDHLTKAFTACMAAHGAQPVAVPGGGFTFRNAAAAESACGAYVTAIAVTCRTSQLPPGQRTASEAARCTVVAQRTIGPKP